MKRIESAALLVRSHAALTRVDPGFNREGVLTLAMTLPMDRYPDAPARARFYEALVQRLSTSPGVDAAGQARYRLQQWRGGRRCDVVVARERVPRVNPNPMSRLPQWHYRVSIHADPACERRVFHGFMHAAAAADQLAADLRSRVIFVEDGILSLLADYRPQP